MSTYFRYSHEIIVRPLYHIADFLYKPWDFFNVVYNRLKRKRLKKSLKFCGGNVYIGPQVIIDEPFNVELGNNTCVCEFTHISGLGGVRIEDGTMISSHCSIATITHPKNSYSRITDPVITKPVVIGRNCWIGTGAIILPGITIADNAIVGAGAVVTKDVLPKTIVVGSPAKFLKEVNL
ncbi:MAG: hypothetical protein JOZ78_09680 [Chroococcidiopsidaceae cyanobacterium CP_BM_ER_R8_30]|nr:hypothetical protein [Chroococcidiopsidaceae cyanobacterium CP_BM_ER_R8_30]